MVCVTSGPPVADEAWGTAAAILGAFDDVSAIGLHPVAFSPRGVCTSGWEGSGFYSLAPHAMIVKPGFLDNLPSDLLAQPYHAVLSSLVTARSRGQKCIWLDQAGQATPPLALPQHAWPTSIIETHPWIGNSSLSVVIPYRTGRDTVCAAIESAATVVRDVAEIIVIVDGLDLADVPASIAAELSPEARELTRFINTAWEGLPAGRNRGVREARSPFLLYLDADDILLEGAGDLRDCAWGRPDAYISYGSCQLLYGEKPSAVWPALAWDPVFQLTKAGIVQIGAAVFRRDGFGTYGWFPEAVTSPEDWVYFNLAALRGAPYAKNTCLSHLRRVHPAMTSTIYHESGLAMARRLRDVMRCREAWPGRPLSIHIQADVETHEAPAGHHSITIGRDAVPAGIPLHAWWDERAEPSESDLVDLALLLCLTDDTPPGVRAAVVPFATDGGQRRVICARLAEFEEKARWCYVGFDPPGTTDTNRFRRSLPVIGRPL